MKKNQKHFFLLFVFSFGVRWSEVLSQNLVTNYSFEQYDTCPNLMGQIQRALGWSSFADSPDYFNSCANPSPLGVPNTSLGYCTPSDGNGIVGELMFSPLAANAPEYLGRALQQTLSIGQKYFVSFKVSLSKSPGRSCAINKIGVKFTTYSLNVGEGFGYSLLADNNSQVYSDLIISDTVSWTTISGSFIADSAYQFIIIGNFFQHSFIDTLNCYSNFASYYFIDEICVSIDSLDCVYSSDGVVEQLTNSTFGFFPNPVNDILKINNSCKNNNYQIINSLGQIVKDGRLTNEINYLNLSSLSDGIYFLSIDFTIYHKIIIEH